MRKFVTNLFSKKSKKEEFEWETMKDQKQKGKKSLDLKNATACYQTETAPKTQRGPKSWAGGFNEEVHEDYGNLPEVAIQNRRREAPQFASTRQNRTAYSEYGGGERTRMCHVTYKEDLESQFSYEEEIDVRGVVRQLRESNKKVYFISQRKNYYKSEWRDAMMTNNSLIRAFHTKEEENKRRIEQLEKQIEEQRNQIKLKNTEIQMLKQMLHQGSSKHDFTNSLALQNEFFKDYQKFESSCTGSRIVSDPRQYLNNTPMDSSPFNVRDEIKIFKHEDAISDSSSIGNTTDLDISP